VNTPTGLRRVLKFRTVVSTSTGLSYAAVSLLGCIQLSYYLKGDSGWLAILISGLLAFLAALCFSELNALYPTAAAIRLYMKEAISDKFSLIMTFSCILTIVAIIAADSYIIGKAITYTLNLPDWASLVWILALLGLAMGANLRGIKIAGLLQDITTYSLLAIAIVISLIALSRNNFQLHSPFAAFSDPGNLFNAIAVGVFVFSAFEWVTPLSEEISNIKLIPRGMFISLVLLFVSYSLFTVASSNALNVHDAGVTNSPVPQLLLGNAALGQVGIWIMLLATLLTAVMTFNGGFATASRFLYAAAREDTIPQIFSRISISHAVPYVSVVALTIFSAVIAVIVFITGKFQILILVGAVLESIIYAVAGVCVIQLRRRKPAAERSFRIWGGWVVPVATIVIFGVLAILASIITGTSGLMTGTPLAITLFIFLISGLYVYLIVPRLRAAAAARRAVRTKRRPQ
jgi:basic amino acid/polyamine antiporter, APA family